MSIGMGTSTKAAIIASARTIPMIRLVSVLIFTPPINFDGLRTVKSASFPSVNNSKNSEESPAFPMDFSHINVIKYGISVLVILLERTSRMAAQ